MPDGQNARETEVTRMGIREETSETMTELSEKLIREMRQRRQQAGAAAPFVEELLKNHWLSPAALEPELLTDLVYAEWMLRLEQGESPSREEYCGRFPAIRQRLERQWTLEESLADMAGEPSVGAVTLTGGISSDPQPFGSHYIGKYKIISKLGSGGQGDVYRALHPGLGRDVVIKLIRPRFLPNSTIEAPPSELPMMAAMSEGRLLAQLSHPNIAQIFDIDQVYGCPFLVMEYVQGHSLDQYHRLHSMNPKQMATLLGKIAFAVAAAHERGVLHRDIKPQNIVVIDEGQPKLIDFGLARISDVWDSRDEHPGLCGTLAFLSPEQASGEADRIGTGTDIFALGAVLFFLLTGEPLYQGSSTTTGFCIEGLLERAKKCDWDRSLLRNPQIPGKLASICERALQPEPSARFASAREFADAMVGFANPRRIPAWIQIAAAATLLAGVALFAWPVSKTDKQKMLSPQDVTTSVNTVLKPVIHLEEARLDLLDTVPLKSGTLLHLESEIPAGISFVLLSVNGQGRLQEVAAFPARAHNWQWRYPESSTAVLPLTGSAGTECLMLLGTADSEAIKRDSEANTFSTAWQESSDWPQIAPAALLRLRGTTVTIEQFERDLGSPQRIVPNPTEKVTISLEKFAARFQSSYPLIEGIAFSHIDPETTAETE